MKCKAIKSYYEKHRYRSDYFDANVFFENDAVHIEFLRNESRNVEMYMRTIFSFIDSILGKKSEMWEPSGRNGIKACFIKDVVYEKGDKQKILKVLFENSR